MAYKNELIGKMDIDEVLEKLKSNGILVESPKQTLREIATENNSTIVFPLPIDLLKPLIAAVGFDVQIHGPVSEAVEESPHIS